jgi:hypothetical protein
MWISADLIGRTERYPHPPTPLPLSARSLVHERLTNAPSVYRSGFFFVAAQHKSAFVQSFSVTRGFPVTKKSPGVVHSTCEFPGSISERRGLAARRRTGRRYRLRKSGPLWRHFADSSRTCPEVREGPLRTHAVQRTTCQCDRFPSDPDGDMLNALGSIARWPMASVAWVAGNGSCGALSRVLAWWSLN